MKKLLPAISILFAAARASAQLVYEPFNYAGSILDTQVNPGNALAWSKMTTSTDNILLNSGNLSISGLAAPNPGGSVTYGGTGASERLGLGQEFTTGTLYYSLAFAVSGGVNPTTPDFFAAFNDATGTSGVQPQHAGTRLYIRQGSSGSTFNVGVSKNSSTPTDIAWDTTDFALNAPVFVVGSYTFNTSSTTDDTSTLYINPSAANFGAAAAPTVSTGTSPILTAPVTGSDLSPPSIAGIGSFVLRQASATVPSVQVDALRIDRTWAQVTPPVGISWNVDNSGNWSEDAKWSTGLHPNDTAAFVNFGPAAMSGRSINVDGSYSVRTLNFTGTGPYTLNGSGTLNFSTSAAINVMAGNQTISANINMDGDLLASVASTQTLSVTGNVVSNGNSLTKAGAGTLQINNARVNQFNIVGGKVRVLPSGTVATVSKVNALNISNTTVGGVTTYNGTLDLVNNDMVIDYTPGQSPLGTWNGTAYTGILGAIQSGRNGGAWNGAGIITSQSTAQGSTSLTTLGVAEAASVIHFGTSSTALWRGQTVDPTSVLIRYTYAGDANLDGKIDADDYFVLDENYNTSGSVFGFSNGDFNYDGKINGDDYFVIDANFAGQSGPAPTLALGASTVPEPASAIVALAAAIGFSTRRRRRRILC